MNGQDYGQPHINGHVTGFLSGYMDGELSAENMQTVKNHLAVCPQCRARLQQMRSLSRLFSEQPPVRLQTSPQQAAAILQANLPARKESLVERVFGLIWALLPGGLAVSWGLLQAIFVTAFLVSLIIVSGVFPQINALLPQAPGSLLTLLMTPPALSGPLDLAGFLWKLITVDDAVLEGVIIYAGLNLGLAALFAAWMAGWFMSKRRGSLQSEER